MNVLIIEDEKLTAKDLEFTIKKVNSQINAIYICHSVKESIDFLNTTKNIDLIFSDIELGDGKSFEIFQHIETHIPIIFCTAYDMYAIKAFNHNGIDYILKPFTDEMVENALNKYDKLKEKFITKYEHIIKTIEQVANPLKPKISSIIVHHKDKIIPIELNDIAFFYIEDSLNFAYTFDAKKYNINKNLEWLEEQSNPLFFRANRQFLIHRKAIKDVSQHFNRKLQVNLIIPFTESILIGKLKTTEFLTWLSEY